MIRCLSSELDQTGLLAQYLVCEHLIRACRQALCEIALDGGDDPDVRQRAVKILKEIHADWVLARKAVRRELAGPREAFATA